MVTEDSVDGSIRSECGVCGVPLSGPLYTEAHDYLTGQSFQVFACAQCHVAWTSPVPRDLEPYYPRSYRRYNNVIITILKFLYRRRVARWCRSFSKPGRALELGCGDGFMLNALRSFGWSVAGTERTEEMARFAREHFGIKVYVEPGNSIPPDERYDLIVLFQVLEHLVDPVSELKRAASRLAEGGSVIVAVPNFSSWQSRFAKTGWFHLDVPRHLVHFSPASIDHAAHAASLRVSSISFLSLEHDPYGWVQSALNRFFANGNRLTKLLMRAVPWRVGDIFTVCLAGALTPVALVAAALSWLVGRGAIMEVMLIRRPEPKS